MIDYNALKVEITTDPNGLGYPGKTDAQVAALMTAPAFNLTRGTISAQDFMAAVKLTELRTLSVTDLEALRLYVAAAVIDISDSDVQTALGLLFPIASCPNTYANIQVMLTRPASRTEILFGAGTTLSIDDLLTARRQ